MTLPPLPPRAGAYWLVLHLETAATLTVGRFGAVAFPAGLYVYTGSAKGAGGVRARLGRHLRGSPRPRWHIDALRARATPVACGWTTAPDPTPPWECRWAQALAASKTAFVPLRGFGASDCRFHCPAHLVGFPHREALQRALPAATRGTMEACDIASSFLEKPC